MGNALLAEFTTYSAAATAKHDKRLSEGYGVPRPWLQSGAARYGVARASTEGALWQPDPGGRVLLVLPDLPLPDPWDAGAGCAEIADLIGTDPTDPTRWWARTGAAVVLNPEAIERGQHFAEPATVHPHPLGWLQAGGTGLVVLDWSAHLPLHLSGPPSLIASDLALAERLDRALNRPGPKHRIVVSNPRRVAA